MEAEQDAEVGKAREEILRLATKNENLEKQNELNKNKLQLKRLEMQNDADIKKSKKKIAVYDAKIEELEAKKKVLFIVYSIVQSSRGSP